MIASKVVTMPLPHGRDWLYYPDINLLALAPHLDEAGRERCVDEMQAEWRASMLKRLASIPRNPDPTPRRRPAAPPVLVPVVDVPMATERPASVV